MTELIKAKLGDMCRFRAGDAFKKELQGRETGDYPFIKVSDMNRAGNELEITRAENWVSKADVTQNRYKLHQPASVVFAKIGVALTYNRRRIIREPTVIDNNMMSATPNSDVVDSLYFYYLLSTIDFNEVSSGSALPYLTQKDLQDIDVCFHQKHEQVQVAGLLGNLDKKIALNRRMNETLEAMARALFKDWFVDFGPVRAKQAGAPAYLAPEIWELFPDALDEAGTPIGWKTTPLSDLVQLVGGGTPKTNMGAYWDGSIPWYSVVDAPVGADAFVLETEKTITTAGLQNSSARLLPENATIISARGTVGKLALTGREMAFNQSCYGLLPSRDMIGPFRLFLTAGRMVERLQAMAHGSVFSTITRKTFEAVDVTAAPDAVEAAFEDAIRPLFARIKTNTEQNRTLSALRDLLLPKLMSGALSLTHIPSDSK